MPSDGVPQIQIGWLAEVVRRLNQCRKAIAGYSPKVVLCIPEIRQGNPRSWADDGQTRNDARIVRFGCSSLPAMLKCLVCFTSMERA